MVSWGLSDAAQPIFAVNINGFYGGLHAFLQHGIAVGFVSEATHRKYTLVPDVPACLAALTACLTAKSDS